jgi:hypothetical protein
MQSRLNLLAHKGVGELHTQSDFMPKLQPLEVFHNTGCRNEAYPDLEGLWMTSPIEILQIA